MGPSGVAGVEGGRARVGQFELRTATGRDRGEGRARESVCRVPESDVI